MEYRFSDRIATLKPSVIREILKADPDPEAVSFAAGNPSPETFPTAEMAALAEKIFADEAGAAFQYGITEGYPALRKVTAERISRKYNVGKEFDDVIIVSGGQQGIELAAKVLANEGETVICEEPSFIGALNSFRAQNLKLAGVPCDGDGMRIDLLEEQLKAHPEARLIYTIPTFQNPGGSTLSLERRRQMLDLAERYDVMIIEDSPYFELRFEGEYVPTIKSMDTTGRVIFCGSYSKVIAPGIRIGYVCGPQAVLAKMTVAKQVSDVHTNLFFQMLVSRLVSDGGFDKHIADCCALYRHRRDLMLSLLSEKIDPGKATWTTPQGGLFVWVQLPEGYDGMELCRIVKEKKLACVPGNAFCVDENAVSSGIRLNYSLPTDAQIEKGCGILAAAINEFVK